MKKILFFICFFIFSSFVGLSQKITTNDYEGQWNNNMSWTDNNAPDFTIDEDLNYTINGYISIGTSAANQNLSFTNTGQNEDFTIRDTLVVYGDVNHANKGHNIIVNAGAIFIVFGNFTADNKIEVSSGGKFIVTGDLTFNNSPQDDFIDNGGDLYVFGTTSGNADADAIDQNQTEFTNNEDNSLVEFVNNGGVNSLPIELKSFTASKSNQNINLDWVTAKEENFSHFEIERSLDQNNWEQIGMVQGLGESNSDVNYDFTDRGAPFGVIYYRLKAVDIDATFEYSPVVKVEVGFEGKLAVSPNPVKDASNLKIQVPSEFREDLAYVGLFDLNGTKVQEFRDFNTDGSLQINQQLKAGMYILKVNHNGLQENIRVIVQ